MVSLQIIYLNVEYYHLPRSTVIFNLNFQIHLQQLCFLLKINTCVDFVPFGVNHMISVLYNIVSIIRSPNLQPQRRYFLPGFQLPNNLI
jgi:hypothetical protein